jgi:hypothetical protein
MTASTTEATSERAELSVPEEPVAVRNRLRDLAQNAPTRAITVIADGEAIADPLWAAWGVWFFQQNADRAALTRILASYQRELWLWIAGERTWQQCAEGLAGRIKRRLASPPETMG